MTNPINPTPNPQSLTPNFRPPFMHRPVVMATHGMVAAGNPLASQAGLEVLRQGGNAFDAAFATAAVLAVVKPDMNGLGGDAFALCYSAREGSVQALNASGPAPQTATFEYFRANPPRPRSGPAAATVPGVVAAWFAMLERYGTLPAERLLQPAIEYAEEGFPVNYLLAGSTAQYRAGLEPFPLTSRTFLPGGKPPAPFARLYQPQLARTLRRLAKYGASEFYTGETAQTIARYCAENGGFITEEDLAAYQPEWKAPLQVDYRGYTVFGQPPVSQGHILLEALNIIREDDLAGLGFHTQEAVHLLVEATRLAFADRIAYAGDRSRGSGVGEQDWLELVLSRDRARELRRTIQLERIGEAAVSGAASKGGETTYFAVVDRDGNCVSFIQSLFHAFGSGAVAGETGVLLNDRMVGFSLDPDSPNVLAPGKRPVHTLNTCLLFNDGKPYAALGTPGSDGQVQTNLQLITHLIDYDLPVQAAIEAPRWRAGDGVLSIEERFAPETRTELARRGYKLNPVGQWSDKMGGAQAIVIHPESGVLMGGADPRREGYAVGW